MEILKIRIGSIATELDIHKKLLSPAPTYTESEQDIFHLQTFPDIT